MRTIREEARETPVFDEVDVLVAGGGLAGFAAALAAARAGAKTVLLERNGCLGGVATATLMANIGNRFIVTHPEDPTGAPDQVVRGIPGEVVDRLVAAGAASQYWRRQKGIAMDVERLKVILIEMLDDAGARILTHSVAALPLLENKTVRGCFFESKSGRQAILAKNTVDATGEADLAHRAGAECREHRYSSSMLFKLSGVDVERFVQFLGEDPDGFPKNQDCVKDYDDFAQSWRRDGTLFFPHHGGKAWRWLQDMMKKSPYGEMRGKRAWWGDVENIEAFGMYTHRHDGTLVINTGYLCADKIEIGVLSHYETLAQKFCYYAADYMIRHIPGFEKARVEQIGVDLGLRGGRYVIGRSRLNIADLKGAKQDTHRGDVIATTPVMSLSEGVRHGLLGLTCDIPFGSCVPANLSGLLIGSGKSVDTEGGNYRIYRGMSGCMVYGQATGAAAAVASKRNLTADALPIRDVQKELLRQGVRLGDDKRLKELGLA